MISPHRHYAPPVAAIRAIPAPTSDWRFEGNLTDSGSGGNTLSVISGAAAYIASPGGQALGGELASCVASAAMSVGRLDQVARTVVVTAKPFGSLGTTNWSVLIEDAIDEKVLHIVIDMDSLGTTQTLWVSTQAGNLINFVDTGIAAETYLTIAFVSNGSGGWAVYLNGSLFGSDTSGLHTGSGSEVKVGVGEDGAGAIERVRIFDSALSAAQIASMGI